MKWMVLQKNPPERERRREREKRREREREDLESYSTTHNECCSVRQRLKCFTKSSSALT
jgi:hypothetical protein